MSEKTARAPRWIAIATGIVGLIAALFVAAAKYYEIHKARAEAAKAQAELLSQGGRGPAPGTKGAEPVHAEPLKKPPLAAALRAGSVWKGTSTWTQGIAAGKAPERGSPIALVVSERSGDSFRGQCSWGSGVKEDVAEVEGQLTGDRVTFREVKILNRPASAYLIACVWTGTISGNTMQGRWMRATSSDGTFHVVCQSAE